MSFNHTSNNSNCNNYNYSNGLHEQMRPYLSDSDIEMSDLEERVEAVAQSGPFNNEAESENMGLSDYMQPYMDMDITNHNNDTDGLGLLDLPDEILLHIAGGIVTSQAPLTGLVSFFNFADVSRDTKRICQTSSLSKKIRGSLAHVCQRLSQIGDLGDLFHKKPLPKGAQPGYGWQMVPEDILASIVSTPKYQKVLEKVAGDILDEEYGCANSLADAEGLSLTDLPPLFDLMSPEHKERVLARLPYNVSNKPSWLHMAVEQDPKLALFLLKEGMDPNLADAYGTRPLSIAVERQDLEMIEHLLQAGANPNVKEEIQDFGLSMALDFADQTVITPLFRALTALNPSAEVVRLLMEGGGNPGIGKGYHGQSALDILEESNNHVLRNLVLSIQAQIKA